MLPEPVSGFTQAKGKADKLAEIENVLRLHETVREAAVVLHSPNVGADDHDPESLLEKMNALEASTRAGLIDRLEKLSDAEVDALLL